LSENFTFETGAGLGYRYIIDDNYGFAKLYVHLRFGYRFK